MKQNITFSVVAQVKLTIKNGNVEIVFGDRSSLGKFVLFRWQLCSILTAENIPLYFRPDFS